MTFVLYGMTTMFATAFYFVARNFFDELPVS